MDGILRSTFDFLTDRYRLIPTKSLSHVYHTSFALAVALFQLLATCRKSVEQWWTQAVGGFVSLYQDAIGLLKAEGEGRS